MATATAHPINVDHVLRGYLACALWLATDGENGEIQLDETHSVDDYSTEATEAARADVSAFCDAHAADLALYLGIFPYDGEASIGHDFFLTRNHHGTGFWDRSFAATHVAFLARLTEASHAYGSADVYVSDAGTLEIA